MRSVHYLALVAVVAVAVFALWWRRPSGQVRVSFAPEQETTQLSQTPQTKSEPAKPVLMVKKFTNDPRDKGVPFISKIGNAGSQRNDASPMDQYRGLQLSEAVQINGRPQRVLSARAVPNSLYNSSYGPVLFQKNGFSIVSLNTEAETSWSQMPMHAGDRPVVVNPSNGRLGIVTGTLMIKFGDLHEADKLAGRENLQLLSLDESINVGYFKAPDNYQLLGAVDRLSGARDVLRVELEVVEAFKGVR